MVNKNKLKNQNPAVALDVNVQLFFIADPELRVYKKMTGNPMMTLVEQEPLLIHFKDTRGLLIIFNFVKKNEASLVPNSPDMILLRTVA